MFDPTANTTLHHCQDSSDCANPDSRGASVYTLGSNPAERDRLHSQTDERHEHAVALLDRASVQRGWRAVDLGCGPRGTLELLAERVGRDGEVLGLDINPLHVAQAREMAERRGLGNVSVAEADARATGLPSKMITAGLLTADEHARLDGTARAHLSAPGTIVVPHLLFMAWGHVGDAVR